MVIETQLAWSQRNGSERIEKSTGQAGPKPSCLNGPGRPKSEQAGTGRMTYAHEPTRLLQNAQTTNYSFTNTQQYNFSVISYYILLHGVSEKNIPFHLQRELERTIQLEQFLVTYYSNYLSPMGGLVFNYLVSLFYPGNISWTLKILFVICNKSLVFSRSAIWWQSCLPDCSSF